MSFVLSCPVCRAAVVSGSTCRRCRADLTLLVNLEKQREEVLARARSHAARQEWDRALALAHGAEALRSGPDTSRLLAAIYLARRDFSQAWQWLAASSLAS